MARICMSWSHACRPLAEVEVASIASCSKCRKAPHTHVLHYRYITGRQGRTTERELKVCTGCAVKFCDKHSLTFQPFPHAVPSVGEAWSTGSQTVTVERLEWAFSFGTPDVYFTPPLIDALGRSYSMLELSSFLDLYHRQETSNG